MSGQTAEASGAQNMEELLDSFEPMKPLRRGDVVEGIVMRADREGALVNIGHKAEGLVPPAEMKTIGRDGSEPLSVGDEIVALVVKGETAEGSALLSIDRAVDEKGWRVLEKALESNERVSGEILGFNRGGAIVEVEGVQGFVPISQLVSVSRERFREQQERAELSEAATEGEKVDAAEGGDGREVAELSEAATEGEKVDAAEGGDGREVAELSEAATEGEKVDAAEGGDGREVAELSEAATEGEKVDAAEGGDGREVAELSEAATEEEKVEAAEGGEDRVAAELSEAATEEEKVEAAEGGEDRKAAEPETANEPPDVGKELELKVLEVNKSRNRAILSERQAVQEQREERKAQLIKELSEGEVRHGTVTGISSFGAFVDLGGADGLVHISELSWNPVRSPDEVVRVGQQLDVYVLRVDAKNNKIALSLKRLQQEPWETITEQYQVGDLVDATVTKLTDFGAFARLEGSVEGLIHISELTSRVISHPREVVREGDEVELKILRIEPERRRLGLSLRQAEEEEE